MLTKQKQETMQDLTDVTVPEHIAIIMDGNGRWAKKRGLPRQAGHRAGAENLRRIINACTDFGVKVLTIYAFSTENWTRPEREVNALMRIFARYLDQEIEGLHKQGVCIHHMGDLTAIDQRMADKVRKAIDVTKDNDRLILNVAFNYGGRAEILTAVKQMLADDLNPETLTEELFDSYLFTDGLPDPDMVIRTSGELRISNFLIWQAAYAEFFPTPVYWPDFGREELYEAIVSFGDRDRRYGGV